MVQLFTMADSLPIPTGAETDEDLEKEKKQFNDYLELVNKHFSA